jgi:4-amino-4-deoxy-L-arabinose transferase-like glycosyltransferase
MPTVVAFGLPFIPPLALTVAGVVLTRRRAVPRPMGIALTVVGAISLLLVAAVKVWFLSTFDPS